MKVLKLGNDIETNKHKCKNCSSILSYTKYDIKTYYGSYTRVGIEKSIRNCHRYIVCAVCDAKFVLGSWIEEF